MQIEENTAMQMDGKTAMPIELVLPTPADRAAVLDYRREFRENSDSMDGSAGLAAAESFEAWLAALKANRSEETVRPGLVPSTTYLAVHPVNRVLIGMIDIRHRLNDHLLAVGGHVGYSVRKSCRGHGYAAEMLRLALPVCRELGIDRVLITCADDNIASAKTILKNGGVLEDVRLSDGRRVRRYWIAAPDNAESADAPSSTVPAGAPDDAAAADTPASAAAERPIR